MDIVRTLLASYWTPVLVAFAVTAYFYVKNKHSYWQRQGLDGPKPLFVIGNTIDLVFGNTGKLQKEWVHKYGKMVGLYQGLSPTLVVADPEVVQQICIKDFDAFTDHMLVPSGLNEFQKNFLFFIKGQHWKKIRTMLSPTFTSSKMRRMFKLMDKCADDLLSLCKDSTRHNGGIVNLKDMYSLYTFDAISSCCYSFKLDRDGSTTLEQVAKKSELVNKSLLAFAERPLGFLVAFLMPKVILDAINFTVIPKSVMDPIKNRINSIVDERRRSGRTVDDYLQLLLEARLSSEIEVNELDEREAHHVGYNKTSMTESQASMANEVAKGSSTSTKLTDMEVLAHACLLMLVGLETTANLLTVASYILAFHPEIQDKLHEEVAKLATYEPDDSEDKKNPRFSYEDLTCCQYLDSVISESLRFMAPVGNFDRQANRDYYVEKYKLRVPKGGRVFLAVQALHHDPKYWDEPEKVDPMRFMPGRREHIVPGSYIPFGTGPRHCIGMRFSLTESKLALARILMGYRIEKAPNTKFPPEAKRHVILVSALNPLVKLVPRV